ncbi:alpha/beta fold hydrolase [Ketobacter sp.]|uniref:alpha/beta fold hydrolase n=1 Tax=Ketobacter sp. TaxID=2083498 RepID=UPI000F1FC970|nr:alpha/beta hydrolase [Ketobacter sp.]RLT95632.1 MAG: alpha/beta hydrolase [Ketobacter sp.]
MELPALSLHDAPEWLLENIQQPGQSVYTQVDDHRVHMLTWNWQRTDLPVLLLIHGFGAHAHWWSFLAPFFLPNYRVAAIDLPGFGDSEPPRQYVDDGFARAIIACIEHNHLAPVCIVGHSFGGAQAIRAMGMAPQRFSHGIVVDSNVRLPPEPLIRRLVPKGQHKLSESREACMARFRLVPPQPDYHPALVRYIAYHSCAQSAQGWHWKADPNIVNVGEIEDADILRAAAVHIDMIYGENSFLNVDDKPARVLAHFPQAGQLIIIPAAGHHLMVDHPLRLVAAIQSLL